MTNKRVGLDSLIKKLPSQGRFRFFFLFVFVSFTFWLSTKLSNTYTLEQSFPVYFTDIPKGIIPSEAPKKISASLTASGLEILLYRLIDKSITVSLQEGDFTTTLGLVSLRNQQFSIEQQLFDNTKLNQIYPENLKITFSRLAKKVVVVNPQTRIQLRAGYLSDAPIQSKPDSILVRGPQSILDTLTAIPTLFFEASDLYEPISQEVDLKSIPELQLAQEKVRLIMPVSRYSEKELLLQIEVINLPLGVRVKLFPPTAKLRATLPVELLSTVKETDFRLVVDYENLQDQESKSLKLILLKQPPGLKQLIWEPKEVNYLIRK
jgi:hypothetical protein|tara:strand:- start:4174 stop:5136 length:963 start_codon:yes stop_codon:yes gene_type:complete